MPDQNQDIRWKQRFENYNKALDQLEEACENSLDDLSRLEQLGVVQLFELCFELGWKLLRDKLEFDGISVDASPRKVIKSAFQSGLLTDGQIWIDMMLHRNRLSHTYDVETFESLLHQVLEDYLPALTAIQQKVKPQAL